MIDDQDRGIFNTYHFLIIYTHLVNNSIKINLLILLLSLFNHFSRAKKVSSLYVDEANENLLIGTEGGNIYFVDLETFSLTENIIYQDVTMQK